VNKGQAWRLALGAGALMTNGVIMAHASEDISAPVALLRAASGLALTFFVPGLSFLSFCRRLGLLKATTPLFYALVYSALITLCSHAAAQKALVLSGQTAEPHLMLGAAAVMFLLGAVLSAVGGKPVETIWPSRQILGFGLVTILAVSTFAYAVSPPHMVPISNYIPEQIYRYVPQMQFKALPYGTTISPGTGWRNLDDGGLELIGESGNLILTNEGDTPAAMQMRFLAINRSTVDLYIMAELGSMPLPVQTMDIGGGGYLKDIRLLENAGVVLHSRFDSRIHPRNRMTSSVILAPKLNVPPGQHILRFTLTPDDAEVTSTDWPVRIYDLSGLSARDTYRALTRSIFIGDMGDTQETLDMARNFRWHWIQHSSTYSGMDMSDGGPTSVADEPPGHHFYCFLAMTFIKDCITSVSLLWLAELALLILVCLLLAFEASPATRWWHVIPLLVGSLIYARLCRYGLESNTPETLYLLVWLAGMKALLDGRGRLAVLLATASFLVHVITPYCLITLAAAMVVVRRDLRGVRFAALVFLALALTTGLRWLIISIDIGPAGALISGQNLPMGSARMTTLKAVLLGGDLSQLPTLITRAVSFMEQGMAITGGALAIVPLLCLVPRSVLHPSVNRQWMVLALFSLFHACALSVIDFHRAHHMGPLIFPSVTAATALLPRIRRVPLAVGILAVLLILGAGTLAYLLVASADYTGTFSSYHLHLWTHR